VLIEYGADITAKTQDGRTMIETSGNVADASRFEALIRHGVPFDPKTQGPTMLMSAAWRNEVDIMSCLLDHGVDPNAKGLWNKAANDYMTPLTAAVTDGQYDAAKLLVDRGAKVDEQLMANALGNRRAAMVKLFWERGDRSISELTYAISQGRPVGEIQKLLDGGMPVDPPQDKKMRPMTLAAELGQMDVVTLLVQRGAEVDDKSPSPLSEAAFEGQDEVVAYLLQHGAKADYQTVWNAVWNCHPYEDQRSKDHFEKTIRLLIDAGGLKGFSEHQSADILCASIFTRYPSGNPTVVKMLLDAGLSLKARTAQGKSVLDLVHEACKQNTCSTPTKEMLAFLDQANKK
jgi:ankyrin repeat protein